MKILYYTMRYRLILLIAIICATVLGVKAQTPVDTIYNPPVIFSSMPKQYEIADIKVTGNENYEEFIVIGYSGLKKGDIIGQGILKRYGVVDGDSADGARVGGLGSTTSVAAMAIDSAKELSMRRDMLLDETYFNDTEKIKEDLAEELEKALYGGQSLFDACM